MRGGGGEETTTRSDEDILQNLNLLLIGDSVALGANEQFYEVFPNSISDAEVGRYATESLAIYNSYESNGWDGDAVIFALGANGPLYDSLNTLREAIGTTRPFFILTARAPVSWVEADNAEVHAFVESTENTYLIDWYAASEGHSEYFYADGTHLNQEGREAFVTLIRNTVLQVYKELE